jgi:hypothetical protein
MKYKFSGAFRVSDAVGLSARELDGGVGTISGEARRDEGSNRVQASGAIDRIVLNGVDQTEMFRWFADGDLSWRCEFELGPTVTVDHPNLRFTGAVEENKNTLTLISSEVIVKSSMAFFLGRCSVTGEVVFTPVEDVDQVDPVDDVEPGEGGEIDFGRIVWPDESFANCTKQTKTLQVTSLSRAGVIFEHGVSLGDWPHWGPVNGTCGVACLAVLMEDGSVLAGKFDWFKVGQRDRDFKNVYSGYGAWEKIEAPKPGQTVWFFLVNKPRGERTNLERLVWP